MASSNRAMICIGNMHEDMRHAISIKNAQVLYAKLVDRLVTQNRNPTLLTEKEKSDKIYAEVLYYVCEQYPYPYLNSASINLALLNTLYLLKQHIFYSPEVIVKALEKAAVKSQSNDKQLVLNHLMPIILADISAENFIEILLGASGAVLNNFLKAELAKLSLQQKQRLLSSAMNEKKLVLVGLLINTPRVFEGVGDSVVKEFFQHVSLTPNLPLVKALLAKDFLL